MSKTSTLIARIREGWYDGKLEVLMANAERKVHDTEDEDEGSVFVDVFRACMDRKWELTADNTVRMPSQKLLNVNLPKGITCQVCHPGLRATATKLAQCVRTCLPWSIDIGYTPTSIISTRYMGLPAIKTRIGKRQHNVACTAVLEGLVVSYVIETTYPDGSVDCEVFAEFEPALQLFDREVEDECLL